MTRKSDPHPICHSTELDDAIDQEIHDEALIADDQIVIGAAGDELISEVMQQISGLLLSPPVEDMGAPQDERNKIKTPKPIKKKTKPGAAQLNKKPEKITQITHVFTKEEIEFLEEITNNQETFVAKAKIENDSHGSTTCLQSGGGFSNNIPTLIQQLNGVRAGMEADPALVESAQHIRAAVTALESARQAALEVYEECRGRKVRQRGPRVRKTAKQAADEATEWLRNFEPASPLKQ